MDCIPDIYAYKFRTYTYTKRYLYSYFRTFQFNEYYFLQRLVRIIIWVASSKHCCLGTINKSFMHCILFSFNVCSDTHDQSICGSVYVSAVECDEFIAHGLCHLCKYLILMRPDWIMASLCVDAL